MHLKYRHVVLAIILILLFCGCGTRPAVSEDTAAPPIFKEATLKPEPSLVITPSPSPSPSPTETPVPTPSTMWGAKFPGMFTEGEIIQNDSSVMPALSALSPRFEACTIEVAGSYKSKHVNVTVNKVKEGKNTYFVSDIYITDLKYFISPSDVKYRSANREYVYKTARKLNAVIAINGDYCANNRGPVLRDGVLYRNEIKLDILVMYKDGTMKTFTKDEYDKKTIEAMKDDAWQIWTFGPMLLKDGAAMSEFNLAKKVGGVNPRTALGYYEPGHYVFVNVDGRQPGYSVGMTMTELSQLMHDLGCKEAFNLDGGGTAQMAFLGKWTNKPSVKRKTLDVICIIDEPSAQEAEGSGPAD